MRCEKDRLEYVDIAKGIGIIAVLLAHAGIYLKWVQPYYMPMFFAVSGCIFGFLRRNIESCIKSAKKMAKLYLKYSSIIAILYIPLFFVNHNDYRFLFRNIIGVFYARKALFSPLELERNIIFMQFGNAPIWFLACLAMAWLLFVPLYIIFGKSGIYGSIIIVLYVGLSDLLAQIGIMLPWSIDTAFIGAVFIFLGTKYEMIREQLVDITGEGYKSSACILIILSFIVVFYNHVISKISILWNMSVGSFETSISSGAYFFTIFCALGTFGMLSFCCLLEKLKMAKIVAVIGKNSLEILCTHAVIYQYIDVINDKINLSEHSWYVPSKVLFTLICCIIIGKSIKIIESKYRKT